MFTGIIQDIGEIASIDKKGDWILAVRAKLPLEKTALGASIACNGVCLTVIEKGQGQFKAQVSAETLSRTTALHWKEGTKLNLEPALRVGDELGGHMVFGHVDGLARLAVKRKDGDGVRLEFEVPEDYARFLATKGSLALDGVSLTINDVNGARFGVILIPHTQTETGLASLEPGAEVNFEVDMLARYADRLLNRQNRVGEAA